jgi:hypothetical protein
MVFADSRVVEETRLAAETEYMRNDKGTNRVVLHASSDAACPDPHSCTLFC